MATRQTSRWTVIEQNATSMRSLKQGWTPRKQMTKTVDLLRVRSHRRRKNSRSQNALSTYEPTALVWKISITAWNSTVVSPPPSGPGMPIQWPAVLRYRLSRFASAPREIRPAKPIHIGERIIHGTIWPHRNGIIEMEVGQRTECGIVRLQHSILVHGGPPEERSRRLSARRHNQCIVHDHLQVHVSARESPSTKKTRALLLGSTSARGSGEGCY